MRSLYTFMIMGCIGTIATIVVPLQVSKTYESALGVDPELSRTRSAHEWLRSLTGSSPADGRNEIVAPRLIGGQDLPEDVRAKAMSKWTARLATGPASPPRPPRKPAARRTDDAKSSAATRSGAARPRSIFEQSRQYRDYGSLSLGHNPRDPKYHKPSAGIGKTSRAFNDDRSITQRKLDLQSHSSKRRRELAASRSRVTAGAQKSRERNIRHRSQERRAVVTNASFTSRQRRADAARRRFQYTRSNQSTIGRAQLRSPRGYYSSSRHAAIYGGSQSKYSSSRTRGRQKRVTR